MGKFHTVTAILAWIFIIFLLFILLHPFTLSTGVEATYHNNQGLIWLISLAGIATANLFLYLNGVVQRENKKCAEENNRKNTVIESQNRTIIENQLQYISGIQTLNETISENTRKDLKTLELIQKQENRIEAIEKTMVVLEKSIIEFEKYNGKSDKRLQAIEKLLKIHNEEINRLKK